MMELNVFVFVMSLLFDYNWDCEFDENTPKHNIYETSCFGHVKV